MHVHFISNFLTFLHNIVSINYVKSIIYDFEIRLKKRKTYKFNFQNTAHLQASKEQFLKAFHNNLR